MNFNAFSFHPQIDAGILVAGYTEPTAIQMQAIPHVLEGKDMLGLAQTGTGKTAAFVLPMLQRLIKGPRKKVRALVLSPTRELAEQTYQAIIQLGAKTGIKSLAVYGGTSINTQIKKIQSGCEIVVACPGRLLDLMNQKKINLSLVEMLVLDEADQMFDMGFLPDIRKIINALPTKRQTLLFSATMPVEIRSLADEFLNKPITIDVGNTKPVETIRQTFYSVEQSKKTATLLTVLNQFDSKQVLVFTRTKHRARKLAYQLVKAGLPATSLQGNLSQNQRQRAMNSFRSGRVRVLVATDIASRGIDVSEVSHVINYDMPDTAEAYTHRIGRTGRMRNMGAALSFVTSVDQRIVRMIERMMRCSLKFDEVEVISSNAKSGMKNNYSEKEKSKRLHEKTKRKRQGHYSKPAVQSR